SWSECIDLLFIIRTNKSPAVFREVAAGDGLNCGIGDRNDAWALLEACLHVVAVDFRHPDDFWSEDLRTAVRGRCRLHNAVALYRDRSGGSIDWNDLQRA